MSGPHRSQSMPASLYDIRAVRLQVKWNFTKFLVDRDGNVVARYAPATAPGDLAGDIEALL